LRSEFAGCFYRCWSADPRSDAATQRAGSPGCG